MEDFEGCYAEVLFVLLLIGAVVVGLLFKAFYWWL